MHGLPRRSSPGPAFVESGLGDDPTAPDGLSGVKSDWIKTRSVCDGLDVIRQTVAISVTIRPIPAVRVVHKPYQLAAAVIGSPLFENELWTETETLGTVWYSRKLSCSFPSI